MRSTLITLRPCLALRWSFSGQTLIAGPLPVEPDALPPGLTPPLGKVLLEVAGSAHVDLVRRATADRSEELNTIERTAVAAAVPCKLPRRSSARARQRLLPPRLQCHVGSGAHAGVRGPSGGAPTTLRPPNESSVATTGIAEPSLVLSVNAARVLGGGADGLQEGHASLAPPEGREHRDGGLRNPRERLRRDVNVHGRPPG